MIAHSSLPWAWTLYSSGYSSLNASKRASTSHKFDGETDMRVKNIHVPMTSSKRLLSHKNTSWHFPPQKLTWNLPLVEMNTLKDKGNKLPFFAGVLLLFLVKTFKSCSHSSAPRLVDLHWRFEVLWGRQALKPQRFLLDFTKKKHHTVDPLGGEQLTNSDG